VNSLMLRRSYLLVLFLAVAIVPGRAQPPVAGQGSPPLGTVNEQLPLCDSNAIDATFAFRDQPAGEQTVSLYFLNKSNTACRLKGSPNPSFAVDGHYLPVETCPFCKSAPMWNRRSTNPVVVMPGEGAAIDLNWTSTGTSCQWADSIDILFNWNDVYDARKPTDFLFIPSDWPMHICSSVRTSGYRSADDSPSGGASAGAALRVSLLQKTVYDDERATLRVALAEPAHSSAEPVGCASVYTVRYTAPSVTRLDPLPANGRPLVNSYTPEQIREDQERPWPQWKRDFRRRCDIPVGTSSVDAEIGASDLETITHIEWRTAPASGKSPVFFATTTHFVVLDVDVLAPNWGEPVDGIEAGLSVDRAEFTAGEQVPLHIRWENLNASAPLGQGECGEPEPTLEIQDSEHQVLKTIPMEARCFGHGWGPFGIAKGAPQRNFREIMTASPPTPPFVTPIQPNLPGPGVYYLVSVWSPRVLDLSDAEDKSIPRVGAGRLGSVYATARSLPVRVEVVPSSGP
jgi:hypothetical protein